MRSNSLATSIAPSAINSTADPMANAVNSTAFDFQWNTSPTSVICAFPYLIGMSADTMEIRLLVNGNLVHTVTMADLALITSKRDIYFATTAPEFIQRHSDVQRTNSTVDPTVAIIVAGRHQHHHQHHQHGRRHGHQHGHPSSCSSVSTESSASTEESSSSSPSPCTEYADPPFVGQPDAAATGVLTVASRPEHCIQRARSLQKPTTAQLMPTLGVGADHQQHHPKRNISKSVSCSDSYASANTTAAAATATASAAANPDGSTVPPNTPRSMSSCNSCETPHVRTSTTPAATASGFSVRLGISRTSSPFHSYHSEMNGPAAAAAATTDRTHPSTPQCKPLRIFRIPLANLCGGGGANSHASHSYHMRSASVKQRTVSVGNSGNNSGQHGGKIAGSLSNVNSSGIVQPSTFGSIVQLPIATPLAAQNIINSTNNIIDGSTTNTARTTIDEELGGQPTLSPIHSNDEPTILDGTDRGAIGTKRDKLNELNTFNYGSAEPLFTSL